MLEIGISLILGFIGVIFCLFYYNITSTYDIWKQSKIPGPKPSFPFGTMKDVILTKEVQGEYLKNIYDSYRNEKMVGIFRWDRPILLLNDLDLIQDILRKDFSKFPTRGRKIVQKAEPLSTNLFRLDFKRWQPIRNKLSSCFTPGKLRNMFHLFLESGQKIEGYIDKLSADNKSVLCREILLAYSTNVMGSCIFGLNFDGFAGEGSIYRRLQAKLTSADSNWSNTTLEIKESFSAFYEKFMSWFGPFDEVNFFVKTMNELFKYREENNFVRRDFIHLLKDLKDDSSKIEDFEVTDELLAAQIFVVFLAGIEAPVGLITNSLYELSLNQDIQNKLRAEIKNELENNEGILTYETIRGMKYLDKVIKETLRKYPPLMHLMRESSAEYTFNGTNVTIPKGQLIWIPIYGIQRDPNIYPHPDIFDPERFNKDISSSRHPMSFLSFGDGPRNCFGTRFSFFHMRVCIVNIIKKFRLHPSEKTFTKYENAPAQFFLVPKGNIYLEFEKLAA